MKLDDNNNARYSSSHQDSLSTYEVLYQGKCFLAEKKKSGQFIDEWLKEKNEKKRYASEEGDLNRKRNVFELRVDSPRGDRARHASAGLMLDGRYNRVRRLSEGDDRERHGSGDSNRSGSSIKSDDSGLSSEDLRRQNSVSSTASAVSDVFDEADDQTNQRRGTLITAQDQNKTMLLQIDDNRMSIISLDKKSVILEKTFKEISYCTQGAKFSDHFGFICYDTRARQDPGRDKPYVMYIFQCASETVITEVMDTLKKAFASVLKKTQEMQSCDLCPMQQLHKLCEDLTFIKDAESTYNCIQTHIVNLSTSEYADLMNKVKSEECSTYEEANDVLMTKLRIMCEIRQLEHTHGREKSAQGEFNLMNYKHSKLDAFRNKAKKALAFDMFNKNKLPDEEWKPRVNSHESSMSELTDIEAMDQQESPCPSPTAKVSFNLSRSETDLTKRPRSRTLGSIGPTPSVEENKTILQKLSNMGHSIEEALRGEKVGPEKNNLTPRKSMPAFMHPDLSNSGEAHRRARRTSSWRRDIYDSVVTTPTAKKPGLEKIDQEFVIKRSLGKEERQALWRSAIEQTILLNRMDRENRNLQAHQEEMSKKRAQLDYEEVNVGTEGNTAAVSRWKKILKSVEGNMPITELWNAVKDGVPRAQRGEIWQLLANQYNRRGGDMQGKGEAIPEMEPYSTLLTKLTPHQHAILIDLGRTFPQHPYFKSQLGAGQLSLFNILKAYSLVDTEVGYCQGLSFIAGIFLMHVEEQEAFQLLCHLMYCLGLRQQFLPNMVGLQISMYQLARLMRDRLPEVYEHLEEQEVTPTLYAAPWFLTVFSSQFPVGFVSRVYDLLMLEGYPALFKVALALLTVHKEIILLCHSFESSTEVLKVTLPDMGMIQMEKIFNTVMTMDISDLHRDLYTYEVEYHVFQEDMMLSGGEAPDDVMAKLELSNKRLREQNAILVDRLQQQTQKSRKHETVIEALQQSHAKTTSQLHTKDAEIAQHLETIERLRLLVPENLREKLNLDAELSTSSQSTSANHKLIRSQTHPEVQRERV